MEAERWRQTSQLYHAALLRAVPDRAAFVREACGGDDVMQLRRAIQEIRRGRQGLAGYRQALESAPQIVDHAQ